MLTVRANISQDFVAESSIGDACGATFVDRAFLEWLEPKLVNARLISQNITTGGHSVFEPITELLMDRFQVIKHRFDDEESAQIQLPKNYRDYHGKKHTLEVSPGHEDLIIDGVLEMSR
jgi:hypothetical protein